MSFIRGDLDSKPIKDLLLEYKAEVVEEEVVDEEAEVITIILFTNSFSAILIIKNMLNLLRFSFMLHILLKKQILKIRKQKDKPSVNHFIRGLVSWQTS